jgi:hypothetical protein
MVSSVYYNKARNPITVTLRTGEASLVPPKGYLSVTQEQDGSSSLLAMVRKGHLLRTRIDVPSAQPSEEPSPPAVQPVQAISVDVEKPKDLIVEEPKDVPSAEWSRSRLVAYAKTVGFEVDPRASKASLLRSIQEAGL